MLNVVCGWHIVQTYVVHSHNQHLIYSMHSILQVSSIYAQNYMWTKRTGQVG